jgi:hypothetical protein
MSFAGAILACWVAIAAVAFLALSALGRPTARGDLEADLGIVGDAELRMLLGDREEERLPLEKRLAYLGIPGAHARWATYDGAAAGGRSSYTT